MTEELSREELAAKIKPSYAYYVSVCVVGRIRTALEHLEDHNPNLLDLNRNIARNELMQALDMLVGTPRP